MNTDGTDCPGRVRVCRKCGRIAVAASAQTLDELTDSWDYYADSDTYLCDRCQQGDPL